MKISIFTLNPVVAFAASELKKYLRMMMPEGGDIELSLSPLDSGLRLGLMQDAGLDVSDAEDVALDDILYIDTDENGGIIAGDNPRSVLLAVYEYLRRNGCRWLFPGPDGEYVPEVESLKAVSYRHKPSCRYRGPCIEGAVSQQTILNTIDFIPKAGMNLYQSQFLVPKTFYDRYYNHAHNTASAPEKVSERTVRSWKMQTEGEIAKRGIQYHDVGHGWTAAPFGIDTSTGWSRVDDSTIPEEARKYLAQLNGKRGLFTATLNTQFCMSNPEARAIVANYIADYANRHSNVDYIHVWLADSHNNHCECGECVKKTVSDWYVMLLNDIDKALSARNLPTRIVFIAYTETTWAPETETIDNPDRFTLMLAPITRDYTRTLTPGYTTELPPFERNKVVLPPDLDEYMEHFKAWRRSYKGAALAFEYHFWRHSTYDVSGLALARRIYEDTEAYLACSVNGMIACGSQRAYFPNGFAYYVFARKQFDVSYSFEELLEEYYSAAYGKNWREFRDYLYEVESVLPFSYLEHSNSIAACDKDPAFGAKMAEQFGRMPEVLKRGRELMEANEDQEERLCFYSVRALKYHADFVEGLAEACAERARGNVQGAIARFERLREQMSPHEGFLQNSMDHFLNFGYLSRLVGLKKEEEA